MRILNYLFNEDKSQPSFSVEALEERTLLSSVQVFAAGEMGDEAFSVRIDGVDVASFSDVGTELTSYEFEWSETVTADQVRVMFTNDLWDETLQIDRNLTVDKLVIDGIEYQTEDPGVFASGVWVEGVGISEGYLSTETLHTDGYFQYSLGSEIIVRASGDQGTESFDLQIDEVTVATFAVTNGFNQFRYQSARPLSADQIRIVFSEVGSQSDVDENLNVDWVSVDGEIIQTNSPFIFSTGTWSEVDGIVPGYGRGETLHSDGYFQFASGTVIDIHAFGDLGDEEFELVIDEQVVQRYQATASLQSYRYSASEEVGIQQIRIQFVNDLYDPENGIDRNLHLPQIQLNRVVFATDAASVYSTGSWTIEDGIVAGMGRGEVLHANGYFQWQAFAPTEDNFSLPEDSKNVPLAVLANDQFYLDGTLQLVRVSDALHGTIETVDGQVYYTPNADYAGADSFTYVVGGAGATSGPIQVTLNVRASHEQPQSQIDDRVATELSPSGRIMEIQKYVQIPIGQNGRQPRLNEMATLGDRIFVVADGDALGEGQIYEIVQAEGQATAVLFLDVGAAVTAATGRFLENSSPQGGLRSLAFHPDFAKNGLFYTSVMEQRPVDVASHQYVSDSPTPVGADSVVVEWKVDLATGEVDSSSYREVFRVGMHVFDHPITAVRFNPFAVEGDEDYGLLYVGHGDGSVQSAIAGDGQNIDGLGKILRVNPLQNGEQSYTVPATNPFVDDPAMLDEVYALGFRNPHNLTFAKDADGNVHLIVTEVGRDNIEEINIVVAGGNYGWALREGPFVHTPTGNGSYGINGNIEPLPADEVFNGLVYPTVIWGHDGAVGDTFVAQAVTGGHVISDPNSPLYGQFIFAEFATDGRAYHVDFQQMLQQNTTLDPEDPNRDQPSELTWLTPSELTIMFDHDSDPATPSLIRDSIKDILDDEPDFQEVFSAGKTRADLRFGQGPNGELYIMNKRNGWVYLVTNSVGPIV